MSSMTPITAASPVATHSNLTQASVIVGKRTYQAFSPTKASSMMMFTLFSELVDNVLKDITHCFNERRTNPPAPVLGGIPPFKIGIKATTKSIDLYAEKQLEEFEPKSGTLSAKKVQDLTSLGLSVGDAKGCTKMAKMVALSFFAKNEVIFFYEHTKEHIQNWVAKATLDSSDHVYQFSGSKKSDGPVTFTDEDLKAFGISRDAISLDPSKISCLGFALLRARELKATKFIFKSYDDGVLKTLFQYLGQWQYQAVSSPMEGDLVVYMTDDNSPKHVGVMAKEGKVHSKLGILNSHSHLHRLFDIFPSYGRKVVFFRKAAE